MTILTKSKTVFPIALAALLCGCYTDRAVARFVEARAREAKVRERSQQDQPAAHASIWDAPEVQTAIGSLIVAGA